jgi:uncharacterized protein (TIGR02246 family)
LLVAQSIEPRDAFVTCSVSFFFSSAATFEFQGFQSLDTHNLMNWRRLVLLGYVAACVFAASTSTAQMMGHGNSLSRIGMRGAFTPPSNARMPMHRAPMNPALGLPRNRSNYGDFDRHNRFRRVHGFNKIIFIRGFGLPWWCGLSWGSHWSYYPPGPYEYSEDSPSSYSYPSYYSGYGYGYGNYGYDYGYRYPPLLYYGGYHSPTNSENDESVVRDVLAEYTVSWNRHDTAAFGRLFAENCDYVNTAGVHWKGVQEIVQRHAELFQNRLKTASRRVTGAEVTFSTPDVALVHATWDVTGWSRSTGEAVPVLKNITTVKMVKANGKWLITEFQDKESEEPTQ